jgi:hypothetical protein
MLSQTNPMAWSVAILKLVFSELSIKRNKTSTTSIHCDTGSSTAAIADTTWAAMPPAFCVLDPRVTSALFLTVFLVSAGSASHLLE